MFLLWPTHTHLTGSVASHSYHIHLHAHPRLTCQLNNSYVLYTEVTNHNRCESQDNIQSRRHNKPKRSHNLPTSVKTTHFHPAAFVNFLKKKCSEVLLDSAVCSTVCLFVHHEWDPHWTKRETVSIPQIALVCDVGEKIKIDWEGKEVKEESKTEEGERYRKREIEGDPWLLPQDVAFGSGF